MLIFVPFIIEEKKKQEIKVISVLNSLKGNGKAT